MGSILRRFSLKCFLAAFRQHQNGRGRRKRGQEKVAAVLRNRTESRIQRKKGGGGGGGEMTVLCSISRVGEKGTRPLR